MQERLVEERYLHTVLLKEVDDALGLHGLLQKSGYALVELGVGHSLATRALASREAQHLHAQYREVRRLVLVPLVDQALAQAQRLVHQLALLQESNNYYALCKDLTFAESDRISYRFTTRKIDSSYPSLYADIDKEWKETSHNFITDESFRLAPFNYSFGKNSKYRFFVEIKYEPCFPDYPALLGLEQSMERLCLISKEDLNQGKKYKNYKMQVRDCVSGYIKERIPALKVKEINVAIGLRSMFDWP